MRFRRINIKNPADALLTQRFARNNDLLNYGYCREAFQARNIDSFMKDYAAAVAEKKLVMRFVAIRGQVIGHLWLSYKDPVPKVDNIFFRHGTRGRGYGPRALKWAEAHARHRGHKDIVVGSSVANERSKRFYEREGWRLVRKTHEGASYRWAKPLVPGKRA